MLLVQVVDQLHVDVTLMSLVRLQKLDVIRFVSDVETIDVKRQLYGWIQLILVYLLNPLSVSPCAIIVHRAWFALIEPKMSLIKLIWPFDKSRLA